MADALSASVALADRVDVGVGVTVCSLNCAPAPDALNSAYIASAIAIPRTASVILGFARFMPMSVST